jgi:hypothetical protein
MIIEIPTLIPSATALANITALDWVFRALEIALLVSLSFVLYYLKTKNTEHNTMWQERNENLEHPKQHNIMWDAHNQELNMEKRIFEKLDIHHKTVTDKVDVLTKHVDSKFGMLDQSVKHLGTEIQKVEMRVNEKLALQKENFDLKLKDRQIE